MAGFFICETVGGTVEDGRASPCASVNRKMEVVDVNSPQKGRSINFVSIDIETHRE
jgi:hypothetical protein